MTILDHLPDFVRHLRDERQLEPSTIANYQSDLQKLYHHVGPKDVREIDINDIRGWIRGMKANGQKPATIRRKIHTCSAFWKFLHIIDVVDHHMPTKVLHMLPKYRRKVADNWLTEDELKAFVSAPAPTVRDTVAWLMLAWLGLRRGELSSLKCGDIHLDERRAIVRGKGGHQRILPIPDDLQPGLQMLMHGQPDDAFLFRSQGCQWSVSAIGKAFDDHVIRAGLGEREPKITPHVLRHTFATHLVMRGVPLIKVSRLLGHTKISHTEIYAHHAPEHLLDAMESHPLKEA